MKRREFLAMTGVGALLALTGCGRGLPAADFDDAVQITEETLLELLLGTPPDRDATRRTPPDPPLLKAGLYDTVLLSVDAEGFARVSKGSVSVEAGRELQRRVVDRLNQDLQKQGFSARGVPFGQRNRGAARTLRVILTPTTEEGGSPRERAEGKNPTYLLVRLTIEDPASGAIVRQRDYYSGRTVKRDAR